MYAIVKMSAYMTSATLIALCLIIEIPSGLGEVTVLRMGTPSRWIDMCLSEDDGGALVWNHDLQYQLGDVPVRSEFLTIPRPANHAINCPLNDPIGCTSSWNTSDWQMTNSVNRAMGPVLDKRWEDFVEIGSEPDVTYQHVANLRKEGGAVSFSLRGRTDGFLLLCNSMDLEDGFCYWIVIGGWLNGKSILHECSDGVPYHAKKGASCGSTWDSYIHDIEGPLHPAEWRTFTLKWETQTRTVSVFDDTERILHVQSNYDVVINELFVKSPVVPALFRFHFYHFLHTTSEGARLLSPEWNETRENFCVEMSVGLCSGCELEINVVNRDQTRQRITTVSDQPGPLKNYLPTWQFVKKNTDLPVEFQNLIRLEIITSLRQNSGSPLWAVASVRECDGSGVIRYASLEKLRNNMEPNEKFLTTNSTCQKLSYNGSSVVNLTRTAGDEPTKDLSICPEGMMGPHCTISCKMLGSNDCKVLTTCNKTGCVCSQGFKGPNCTEPAPLVKNLRYTDITDRKVTLEWDPLLEPNGSGVEYVVSWKVVQLKGCQDLGKPTPEQKELSITVNTTTASLDELHPYAEYSITVIAHKADDRSELSRPVYHFETKDSELPTSVIENLRFEGDTLMWDYPSDCTTITGPTRATELIFNGISDHVRNSTITRITTARSFKLDEQNGFIYGATIYRVRAYVSKQSNPTHHNESAYRDLIFTTKPRAPPPVEDLEVYEFDSHEKKVSLRWSPSNIYVESYSVSFCDDKPESRNHAFVVPVNSTCKLWDNYVCATLSTQNCGNVFVWANNKDGSLPGAIREVSYTMQDEAPEAHANVTVIELGNGMVNLTWSHPWRTNGKLLKFHVNLTACSTDLRKNESLENSSKNSEILVHDYHREYSKQLNLRPSSVYELCIRAETRGGIGPCKIEKISTRAAMAFENEIFEEIARVNTTLVIALPSISNDTRDSTMHVIVKGSTLCEPHSELSADLTKYANVRDGQVAWRAASFSNGIEGNQTFTIGDNKTYEGAWNCPLNPAEAYEIVIVVQGGTKETENCTIAISTLTMTSHADPLTSGSSWFVAATIAGTTVFVIVLIIFIGYRKREVILKHSSNPMRYIVMSRSCEPEPNTESDAIINDMRYRLIPNDS